MDDGQLLMRLLPLFILCATVSPTKLARADVTEAEPCGAQTAHERLLQSNTAYASAINGLPAYIEGARENGPPNELEVHTLPVVVHVIHRGSPLGESENISDAQIFSAIEALNQDFRKTLGSNGDGAGVDTHIQFELAKRSPEGEPTNGILRLDGRSVAGYEEDGIASSSLSDGADDFAVKSLSSWSTTDYVNIFVVPEINGNDGGGGIQGYAYLGPTNDARDGLVLLANVFGSEGEIKLGNMNRVTTHEMGHYLSLYHTFQNVQSCEQNENDCNTAGDQVCDTPVTTMNNTCSDNPCEAILENYMDYTPQSCRNMFTEGQRDRMRAMLETGRATLLDSLGAIPVVDRDLTFSSVLRPPSSVCVLETTAELVIRNQGSETVTGFTVSGTLNGHASQPVSFNEPIAAEGTRTVSFPLGTAQSGENNYTLQVSLLNGSDDFPANDTTSGTFTYVAADTWTLALTTGFFANEFDWAFTDATGAVLMAAPESGYPAGITDYRYDFCAPYGCYEFTLTDGRGEGMPYGGKFTLTDQTGALLAELTEDDNAFGASITFDVCTTGEPPPDLPPAGDSPDGGAGTEASGDPDDPDDPGEVTGSDAEPSGDEEPSEPEKALATDGSVDAANGSSPSGCQCRAQSHPSGRAWPLALLLVLARVRRKTRGR